MSWLPLQAAPETTTDLVCIDDFNFVFAAQNGIFNYNTLRNTWSTLAKYDANNCYHQSAYNKSNQKLYIHVIDHELITYHCKTNKFKTLKHDRKFKGVSYIKEIEGEMHLIVCGAIDNKSECKDTTNNYHLKWNVNEQKFQEIYKFDDRLYGGLIYIKSKQLLLKLGVYDSEQRNGYSIWSHSIGTKQWEIMKNVKIPIGLRQKYCGCNDDCSSWCRMEMYSFKSVITSDDKYVIIFCDPDPWERMTFGDMVCILNTDSWKWTQSKIKCPFDYSRWCFEIILISNKSNDKLLVSGYVRNIINIDLVSQDLIDLVSQWYSLEFLHVVSQKGHWKINIDEIIS